jgi:small subunit ribosomal protein S5
MAYIAAVKEWIPKTSLGKAVRAGEITSMEQVYEKNIAILEPEILDTLVPGLHEEVLKVKMVQRTTDSGRKGSFMVTVAVGNNDGYVGIGIGKGNELRPTIGRAIRNAKKNIIHVRRGCGSWECGCNEPHSIPFRVYGRHSSSKIDLLPAPKGTGVVAGDTAKKVLELAGIKDVWSQTKGDTRTALNFAIATLRALQQTRSAKLKQEVGTV